MLFKVRICNYHAFFDRRSDPVTKPALNPEMQEQGRKDGNHNRRRYRHKRKHQNHTGVKLCARDTTPTFDPNLHQFPGHQCCQQQHQHQIGIQQQQDQPRVGLEWRRSRHRKIGCSYRYECGCDQAKRKPARLAQPPQKPYKARPQKPVGDRTVGIIHFVPLTTSSPRSRIFLRRVLRFNPRTSAALT